MTPIIITLSLLIPSKQGRINSGTDLCMGTEVRFMVFIPDLMSVCVLQNLENIEYYGPIFRLLVEK